RRATDLRPDFEAERWVSVWIETKTVEKLYNIQFSEFSNMGAVAEPADGGGIDAVARRDVRMHGMTQLRRPSPSGNRIDGRVRRSSCKSRASLAGCGRNARRCGSTWSMRNVSRP